MTPSRFSELSALRTTARPAAAGFASTRSMPSTAADAALAAGPDLARDVRDFARRGGPADGSRQIALVDPAGLWAASVVRMLAAASDAPLRRLTLDDDAAGGGGPSLIGAALARRDGSKLRVDHASTPAQGPPPGNAALALARHSDLGVVIVGPLAPADVDDLLAAFFRATREPAWECPRLLFLLPPGAAWMARKIDAFHWPAGLRVHHDDAVLNGAAAVWNRVLAAWEVPQAADAPPPAPAGAGTTLQRARECLQHMLEVDGLIACAVVDAASGQVLARESRDTHGIDLDAAAAGSAVALRAHRRSVHAMGMPEGSLEELTLRAGHRVLLLRMSPAHAELFLLVLLDGGDALPLTG